MPHDDGSNHTEPAQPADGVARKARTAAEQREQEQARSNDPEVLAAEITRTREELAETLDAIADRVSPKRVADRTKQRVKDGAGEAAATVKAGAGEAAATVKAGATHLKDAVVDRTEAVREKVSGNGGAGDVAGGAGGALVTADAAAGAHAAAGTATGPAGAGSAPGRPQLHPVPPPGASTGVRLGPPALIGAAAAVLVALLVLRRRR